MIKIPKHVLFYLAVISVFTTFIQNNPHCENSPKIVFQKAEALFNEKKYSEAVSLFEQVIMMDSSFVQSYKRLIECYNKLGDPQGAVVFMESVFLENPETAEVCYGLGYSLYNTKQYETAKNYFEKAIELKPDFASAWNNCAAIYHFIIRDYKKARIYYEKAIEASLKTGDERVMAIAKKNLSNLPEEIEPVTEKLSLEEFINRFISLVDNNDETGIRKLVLGQKKNSEQAMDWLLEKAMRSSAGNEKEEEKTMLLIAQLLSNEYRRSFNSSLLVDNLDAYTSLDDETKKLKVRGDDLFSTGIAMEQQQRYEEAMQQYKESLKCFDTIKEKPKTGLTHIYMGDIYRKTKQYSLARDSYTKGLTVYVETGDEEKKALSLSSLGITYYLLGENFDALDFLQRSLKAYQSLGDKNSEEKVKKNIRLIEARIGDQKQGK